MQKDLRITKNMNNKDLYNILINREEADEQIFDFAKEVATIRGIKINKEYPENIYVYDKIVSIDYKIPTGCSCCQDYGTISFPLSYLLNNNWESVEKIEIQKRKEKKEKEEKELKRKQEEEKILEEKSMLNALKKKYEK